LITVRPSKIEDTDYLAGRLRKADLQEIEAARGEDPLTALQYGFKISKVCFTAIDDYLQPIAIFGVVPDEDNVRIGLVWLLGTDDLVRHSFFFLRKSREWLKKLLQQYDVLWNYVDARNEVHIRWLKWCGFSFLRKIDRYGPGQLPFYEFEIRKGNER
jgi:hypothetical protein